jgi:DNA-binding NarL/FixJ family response regulator
MNAIRVVLADDHALVRAGLRALVQQLPDIEIVAEAQNGHEALQLVKQHRPDLLLTDFSMPEMNGLELLMQVKREAAGTHVLFLSMHDSEEYVCNAIRAGAGGYILKDSEPAELERAMKAVARGESYLTPTVSRHLVADYLRQGSAPADPLTPRQREILQHVAEGRSTKEIARLLHISVKTVETHRAQIMDRLDIHEVAGLVRYAIKQGIVST